MNEIRFETFLLSVADRELRVQVQVRFRVKQNVDPQFTSG
jgi:hypothetical protein